MGLKTTATITGPSLPGGVRVITVTGILDCEEHGEFEVEQEVDPPILSDQIDIFGECPDCGLEFSNTVPVRRW